MKNIVRVFVLFMCGWLFAEDANSLLFSKQSAAEAILSKSSAANMLNSENDDSGLTTTEKLKNQMESVSNSVRIKQILASADYRAVPGDTYQLAYAVGSSAVSTMLVMDPSYKLRIHNLGVLDCRGKTYLEVKTNVENLVAKNYPLSGVQFVLISPGAFTVRVKGEVEETTELPVDGLTRLSVLYDKLEKTKRSSYRNIQITSSNGKTRTYDLFKFYREADVSQNPYLAPSDVIYIPQLKREITLSGEVNRPGVYQLLDSETMADLIDYYGGGFTINSNRDRISISHISDRADVTGNAVIIKFDEITTAPAAQLVNYDTVSVENKQDFKPIAFFEGALNISSQTDVTEKIETRESERLPYRFQPGQMLSRAVVQMAYCFKVTADLENAFVQRGTEFIPVNMWNFLYKKDFSGDIALENGDIILIPFKQMVVIVSGAVVNPGSYPYVPNRNMDYYVNLAGGIKETNSTGRGISITDINGNPVSDSTVIYPETRIYVPYNSFSYNFNKYAPTVTTIFSLAATAISVMATVGVFD